MRTNRYLNDNPLEWLLDPADPDIRYITMRDIIPGESSGSAVEQAQRALQSSPRMVQLLSTARGGILGNSKSFDLFYHGTMWCFAESVARGLCRRNPVIETTAEFLFSQCQTELGGFTLNWRPPVEVSCRTGDMLRYLILAGYEDERIESGIRWIVEHQRHDGGWLHCPIAGAGDMIKLVLLKRPGSGLKREDNPMIPSCIYATASCMRALCLYYSRHKGTTEAIRTAAGFFLKNRLFAHAQTGSLPLCGSGRNADVGLLGYPVMSQYDILYGLLCIAEAGYADDPGTGECFNRIISKQNPDGTWNLENKSPGMLYENRKSTFIGKKNKWVTLNALRFFKLAGLL